MLINDTTQAALELAVKADTLEAAEAIMNDAGILTYGVEYVSCESDELAYINLGDTYDATICRENDGPLFIGSWGDWYESAGNELNEADNTITCGYCSHRTPMDCEDWHDVVCESCGHHVDGAD